MPMIIIKHYEYIKYIIFREKYEKLWESRMCVYFCFCSQHTHNSFMHDPNVIILYMSVWLLFLSHLRPCALFFLSFSISKIILHLETFILVAVAHWHNGVAASFCSLFFFFSSRFFSISFSLLFYFHSKFQFFSSSFFSTFPWIWWWKIWILDENVTNSKKKKTINIEK